MITNSSCFGESTGSARAIPSGGDPPYQYFWDNQPATESLTGVGGGMYQVKVIDSNGCMVLDTASVNEYPRIQIGKISGSDSVIASGVYTYSVLLQPDAVYTWNIEGGIIIAGQSTNQD